MFAWRNKKKYQHFSGEKSLTRAAAADNHFVFFIPFNVIYRIFDLITAYTPIIAQSRNSAVLNLQPVYFLSTSLQRHMLWVPI